MVNKEQFQNTLNGNLNPIGNMNKKAVEYFTRIPAKFIKHDIEKEFGLSRKFLFIYILLDKHRSFENISWITIEEINECFCFQSRKAIYELRQESLAILSWMQENQMISTKFDFNDLQQVKQITHTTCIKCIINPTYFENFEEGGFVMLTTSQFNDIIFHTKTKKEIFLHVFLYVRYYLLCASTQSNHNAFWQSVETISKRTGINKRTISKALDSLVNEVQLLSSHKFIIDDDFKGLKVKELPTVYMLKADYQIEQKNVNSAKNKFLANSKKSKKSKPTV